MKNLIKKIIFITAFLILAHGFCFSEDETSKRKVALVIGNGAYTSNNALKNPVNDAKAIRDVLKTMGFEVSFTSNADIDEMDKYILDFYSNLKDSDSGVFYFSGHGIENDGENYILPISSKIKTESDLKRNAVSLSEVMKNASFTNCKQVVFFIDACRNNPISNTRGSSRGLIVVNDSDIANIAVAYACGSKKTADDGLKTNHSPFTEALLKYLPEQNIRLYDMMQKVKTEVYDLTEKSQLPEYHEFSRESIYLNGKNDSQKEENHYQNDNTVTVKLIRLCIILFLILIIVMIICFVIFTEKGRLYIANIAVFIKEKAIITYQFSKANLKTARETGVQFIDSTKKTIDDSRRLYIEKAAEKKKLEEEKKRSEFEYLQNCLIPSVNVDSKIFVTKTPITIKQFNSIIQTSNFKDENNGEIPLTDISWYDGALFFNELSKKENLECVYDLSDKNNVKIDYSKNGWRFPTEAEWKSFASSSISDLNSDCWYKDNSEGVIKPCGQKKCSSKGLYDVYGLVWEWCNDSYKNSFVVKGGAWDCTKNQCSKNSRLYLKGTFTSDAVGLRGVRNI